MRSILAIGLASLLAFTAPVSAADLGLPVYKAPPLVAAPPPPEFDFLPLVVGALVVGGIVACVLECRGHHQAAPAPPASPGAVNAVN